MRDVVEVVVLVVLVEEEEVVVVSPLIGLDAVA